MRVILTHDIVALRLDLGAVRHPATPGGGWPARELQHPGEILESHALLGHRIRPERIAMRQAHGLHFIVLYRDERPVASTWLVNGGTRYIDELCWGFPLQQDELWVRDVFVRPDQRGQGLFSRLMMASTRLLAPNWTAIWSDVDAANIASLKAHHSAGFVDVWRASCRDLLGRFRWRPAAPAWPRPTEHLAPDRRLVCLVGATATAHRARIA